MKKTLLRLWIRIHNAVYRATQGAVLGLMAGAPVLLLTTTGRKSVEPRKFALIFGQDGSDYLLVASKGGAPEHPAWYHNVKANPQVTAQDGTEVKELTARELSDGEERDHWWELAVAAFPPYAEYQTKTERQIPVFVLE